jgi:hypothetical protein
MSNDKPEKEASSVAAAQKGRSPNYPYINLEQAVAKLPGALASMKRHPVGVESAVSAMSLKYTSSSGKLTLAAMRAFGFFEDAGKGMVKLSPTALDIAADFPPQSPGWRAAVQKAALSPNIHKKLWDRYKADLPADDELRRYLVRDLKFTDSAVGDFIDEYKHTIDFSGLATGGAAGHNGGQRTEDPPPPDKPNPGDKVLWKGPDDFLAPKLYAVGGISDDGEWVFLQGVRDGVPMSEITVQKPESPQLPPRNPAYGKPDGLEEPTKPGMETDRTNLAEGPVVLQWPSTLTKESVADLDYWIKGVLRRAQRKAGIDPDAKNRSDPSGKGGNDGPIRDSN